MSTLIDQVEAFRQYVLEQSQVVGSSTSIEDLFENWSASQVSSDELQRSLESLKRGLADADAGRVVDAEAAINQTRDRL